MQLDKFEKAVVTVAIVVLVICLVVIGILLSSSTDYTPLPAPICPDFWYSSLTVPCNYTTYKCCPDSVTPKIDASGSNCGQACGDTDNGCCPGTTIQKVDASGSNCSTTDPVCYNLHKLGDYTKNGCLSQDFNDDTYTGSNGLCQKQKWATTCAVAWDGVTNISSSC
jgi:hypothetical protein